jgi:hypothetical protein
VTALATRYGQDPAFVRSQIQASHQDFQDLSPSQVEVRKSTRGHPIKLVLFDRCCLLVTYSLRPRTDAPALAATRDGDLYRYVRQEFEAAWDTAKR